MSKATKEKHAASEENNEVESAKGFLRWIEIIGNKLPHPFWLFVWICVFIVVISGITAYFNVEAIQPGTGENITARNLLSGEGLRWFVENLVTNFAHFAPLGLVLVMLMGVSVAEQSGLLTVVMRRITYATPKKVIFPVIFMIGAMGNIGSDAGVVVVPPIAAIIFMQMGYHPIAGLVAGYAGATAGFTANVVIAGTDVLLAGISTQITQAMNPPMEVSATANWYFMIASTLMLGLGGAFIVRRFTIPRTKHFAGMDKVADFAQQDKALSPEERKGLKNAGISVLIYLVFIALLVVPPGAPLRNPETGGIVPSPFLRGLVPVLFFLFAIPGYFYGKATGAIKKKDDILKFMEQGMKNLSGYIVLMLVVAQFVELFSRSNLDSILAIQGANFLEATGLTGILLFVLFIILIAFLNIFLGSGSAKWAIFAPVFIPMLAQLGYSPAFVQLMYRVGDSITNCVSPLYVYFPLILGWIHQYDKRLKIGTIISLLVPYAIVLLIMWILLIFIWYIFNIPIGVGEFIYM
ncbi:MAG: AbgT family transporter [Bacteroidales bacterium]|nr:AbgT family transporter [Bacteroidales bacterium]MCF8327324.1 AbgT family transporter [Bacteroidales bacterium]